MRLPAYEQLSVEQDRAINLDTRGNYLVTGPPGSGKTVVALHRATQFRGASRLIMHSKVLTGYTRSASDELELGADSSQTYHQYLYRYWRQRFKTQVPQSEPFVHDWPAILTRVVDEPNEAKETGHVIVDEGQDLPREFYFMLQNIADDGFTIFADENQRIGEHNSDLKTIQESCGLQADAVVTLRRNYRNTMEIALVAKCYYTGLPTGVPDLPERRGELPLIRKDRSSDAVLRRIVNHSRNHPNRVIGVLLPRIKQVRAMKDELVAAGLDPALLQHYSSKHKTPVPDFSIPGIKVLTHASTKGLEFDSVFLPWVDAWSDLKEPRPAAKTMMYVLTSRAREFLELSYTSAEEPGILQVILEGVADRREQ
jgi:DNA helicase IV